MSCWLGVTLGPDWTCLVCEQDLWAEPSNTEQVRSEQQMVGARTTRAGDDHLPR